MSASYQHFLDRFPEANLPLTLKEEDAIIYSAENEPIPHKLIDEFILPHEPDANELTEFIPCFRIKGLKNFDAVVYWKAGLLNYQYILMTFGKGGKTIDRKVLAGLVSDGNIIVRSVARLDDDMSIFIMSGHSNRSDDLYDAGASTTVELELLPDGNMLILE